MALKRKSGYKKDDFVRDDSDEETPAPASKRSKTETSTEPKVDEDGNTYWEISKARRATISEFKGTKMVSIREYYEKDDKWLPGKKGISMSLEQYSAFIAVMPQIEENLAKDGQQVPRPLYDGKAEQTTSKHFDNSAPEEDRKPNIEATSDEEE